MSALWTSTEAAAATGGEAHGAWAATGVSIDTRTLEKGDLFIALTGEARDGHEFVGEALGKGAAAALVSRRPERLPANAPLLEVRDTQAGLEALGRASRARAKARIVGVTGSAGKTTTKEMLRLALSGAGEVAASSASYNNHWGVPLSLARMSREADFGVFEIGMNHFGEIRALVAQVRPHVAIITTIAPAHLEYFGTLEAIADAKSEIFEGIVPGGAALLPADNPQSARLIAHARQAGVERVLTFGMQAGADARLVTSDTRGEAQDVVVDIRGKQIRFRLGAVGGHIATNALAAILAATEMGIEATAAATALARFTPLRGRGARFTAGGIEVIDESYNANPASMAAALTLLGSAQPAARGRRIAVLGDMLELGTQGTALHRGLAKEIAAARADLVFLCGPQMSALWEVLPQTHRGAYAPTSAELVPQLADAVHEGDVILVKGSFGSRMSAIVDALRGRGPLAAA
jgi:UDP-N-acetylmuramoyl-tripeptide--D-alanyl-D-alanine ligase